jgi:hypothetical protein
MLACSQIVGLTVSSLLHSFEQFALIAGTLGALTGTLLLWSVLRPWRIVATPERALLVLQNLRVRLGCAVSALLMGAGLNILIGVISFTSYWTTASS